MKKKKKERDRYFDENLPSNNFDFVEVLTGDFNSLDNYILNSPQVQQALGGTFQLDIGDIDKKKVQKRQKRLLRKILQAASKILTDRQFQVFILRFIFNLTEEEIAKRLDRKFIGRPKLENSESKKIENTNKSNKKKANINMLVSQPYINLVLKIAIKKIKKELRLKEEITSTIYTTDKE